MGFNLPQTQPNTPPNSTQSAKSQLLGLSSDPGQKCRKLVYSRAFPRFGNPPFA
jgi:hypothetical protein